MLEIKLIDNPLTPDPTDYRAMVVNYKRRRISDIVKQITIPGSILKETECEAVSKRFLQILAENLQQGIGFESEFLVISQGVSGVFNSETEAFDPTRHQVTLLIKAGEEFQKALSNVEVVRVDYNQPKPVIKKVFDVKSKTADALTPGHMFDIHGELIKVEDEEDPAQGVFLISTQNEEEVRVEYIYHNGIKRLQVEIPEDLSAGDRYRLEIRSTVNKGKDIRTGAYEKVLTVA
jgi:hypothetical protein